MKIRFSLLIILVSLASRADARPLLTENVAPLTKGTFEAGTSIWVRRDEFESPQMVYKSVVFPVRFRLGMTNRLDLGFTLNHLSHSLETGESKLKGSRPELFSPEIKYSFSDYFGLLGIWHLSMKELTDQELPIARGDDYEVMALFKLPASWSTHLNIGYLFRNSYQSRFGVDNAPFKSVKPGDVFQTRASLEIPLKHYFSLLTEAAYYTVGKKKVDGVDLVHSDGEAMDLLAGLVWERGGWNIGLAAAFGMLEESHTSFDLQRGAGDTTYTFSLSYKLKGRKPAI